MMTEAEALKILAREDPAWSPDAKIALRSLTSGDGLGAISMLRLQEYVWYRLPLEFQKSQEWHLAINRALARLFTLAGMERYAEVCASEQTINITAAHAESNTRGVAAYAKALASSPVVPPDTDLLAWSTVMGPDERAAYDSCANAIELAIAAGDLKVGVSGWKTKRAMLVERWLTRTESSPGLDTWLSRISAERIEEWAHGHPGERSRLARALMPRLLEPPDLPDEPLPTLTWLLALADQGLRLTARHYISPSVVAQAASLFGWQDRIAGSGQRFQELDLYQLHTLRGLAQHEMSAVRRSGSALVLTRTGRLMAEDAAVRWHIGTAALIGPDDGPEPDFTVAVREAALLIMTLHGRPINFDELAGRLIELHAAEGWSSRSGGSLSGAIRGEIHVLRHRLRALQLLDEHTPVGSVGLTDVGTAAALSGLLTRALRPRRHDHL
jgi:hypothetical protein